jgi:acyl-CoA thioesterase YciA
MKNDSELKFKPPGKLVIKTQAMPADTNPSGDIFGGWLLSQMDLGGGIAAMEYARSRVVTVALTGMSFYQPVHVGDTVSVYADLVKTGTTSMTFKIIVWATRLYETNESLPVTSALFTYVSIDKEGRPSPLPRPG